MSDDLLRDMERSAALGDPVAQARLLVERARRGRLEPERLRLAAWLGDATARLATGDDSDEGWPAFLRPKGRKDDWTRTLASWGQEVVVRAAYVVAHDGMRHWRRHHRDDPALPGVLDAVAAWLRCPCAPCAEQVGRAVDDDAIPESKDNRSGRAKWHVFNVAHAVRGTRAEAWTRCALEVIGESPATQVREAIRDALVPWALGLEHDPGGLEPC
jgi:hypothetical protein